MYYYNVWEEASSVRLNWFVRYWRKYWSICHLQTRKSLRAPVSKNQTNSKFRGKGGKLDFFHILMSQLKSLCSFFGEVSFYFKGASWTWPAAVLKDALWSVVRFRLIGQAELPHQKSNQSNFCLHTMLRQSMLITPFSTLVHYRL